MRSPVFDQMGDRFRQDEPLSRRSSLRIGGPAQFWADVETREELSLVLDFARGEELPIVMVGLGSNSLYPDEGIRGVALRLGGELAEWTQLEGAASRFRIGAGAVNAHVVRDLLKSGFTGMEFLALIPGTVGGAVALNAGTREKELSEILHSVEVVVASKPGESFEFTPDELELSYRHCVFPSPDTIVVSATIAVEQGDVDAAQARVEADKTRRNKTQPYKYASVGSTFANPEGDYAGRLIEAVGLKGFEYGGARISDLHANFFINEDNASADAFVRLMAIARHRVRQRFGIELRPEVHFVGFDGWAKLKAFEAELASEEARHA